MDQSLKKLLGIKDKKVPKDINQLKKLIVDLINETHNPSARAKLVETLAKLYQHEEPGSPQTQHITLEIVEPDQPADSQNVAASNAADLSLSG